VSHWFIKASNPEVHKTVFLVLVLNLWAPSTYISMIMGDGDSWANVCLQSTSLLSVHERI